MEAALWIAKTGLDAQQTRMDVISNNLANVNTTAFKSDRANFEDLLYQNVKQPGGQTSNNTLSPTGMMLGTGVKVVSTQKMQTQGDMVNTQAALDLAIQGNGFFQVQMPDGVVGYTRDGTFQLSNTGQVVTALGYPLIPNMTIPNNASSITVGTDGTVSVELVNGQGSQTLGQLQLANFVNPTGLQPIGNNLYQVSQASGQPQLLQPGVNGSGTINQGSLEASNVNVVEEMVNMIEVQRAYEINSKAISTVDDMLKFMTQNVD
jgi:flagellar basal-body rod protein FlgG